MPDASPTLRSLFDIDDDVAKRGIFEAVDATVWDNVAIPRSFREAAAEKVAGALDGLLAVPLSDMLANAFNGCRELRTYADGKEHEVEQFDFSVESAHAPYVELKVAGLPPQRVHFPVTVSLEFSGAILVIRDNRVMSIKAGTCTAAGTLCCEKIELAKRASSPFRFPGELGFGHGIPLGSVAH